MTKKITGSTGEERLEQFFEHYVSFPKVTKWAPVRRDSSVGKTWCGPYALAVISNTPYEFAYAKSKKVLGKRAVMGMGRHEFSKVAKAMSVNCQRFWREREADGCTVAKLRDNLRPGRLYVVEVTGHYIVVDTRDWTVCDNQHGWTPLADWPHRRAKCRNTLDCTTTEIHWPDSELAQIKRQRRIGNGKRYPIRMPMPI